MFPVASLSEVSRADWCVALVWPSAALLQWCSTVRAHLRREITAGGCSFCGTSEWPSANMNKCQSTRAKDPGETFCCLFVFYLRHQWVSFSEWLCVWMYVSNSELINKKLGMYLKWYVLKLEMKQNFKWHQSAPCFIFWHLLYINYNLFIVSVIRSAKILSKKAQSLKLLRWINFIKVKSSKKSIFNYYT